MKPYPIIGEEYENDQWIEVHIPAGNIQESEDDIYTYLEGYISPLLKENHLPYGGYLETRSLYQSPLFRKTDIREIHLGVDVWAPKGTFVFAPFDCIVHSFAYNEKSLDYGATIILELGNGFRLLYGHLSKESLQDMEVGLEIPRGFPFCTIGDRKENGGWYPHLHLQMIFDMEDKFGDYPGVCAEKNLEFYKKNCPDPEWLLGI